VECSSRQFADIVVASPIGRIDHAAASKFMEALVPHLDQSSGENAGLVIDFAGVDYISSIGLRMLMVAAKRIAARGGTLAVAAMRPDVAEIFAISRFDMVLDVRPSVRAALQSRSQAALAAFERAR
jgi:anti-sigma B factor antagonist